MFVCWLGWAMDHELTSHALGKLAAASQRIEAASCMQRGSRTDMKIYVNKTAIRMDGCMHGF